MTVILILLVLIGALYLVAQYIGKHGEQHMTEDDEQ